MNITSNTSSRAGWMIIITVILVVLLAACSSATPVPLPSATSLPSLTPSASPTPVPIQPTATRTATGTPTETVSPPTPTDTPIAQSMRFAVIGDYGKGSQAEADVASLIIRILLSPLEIIIILTARQIRSMNTSANIFMTILPLIRAATGKVRRKTVFSPV
jgi:hypothetical protein